ncbi:hypothetical protein [Thalassotalea sp. HSM 43]|nr:hypothetical protein [Thalassotalea sp. HSM 43]
MSAFFMCPAFSNITDLMVFISVIFNVIFYIALSVRLSITLLQSKPAF